MVLLRPVLVRAYELSSYHQLEFMKEKERCQKVGQRKRDESEKEGREAGCFAKVCGHHYFTYHLT